MNANHRFLTNRCLSVVLFGALACQTVSAAPTSAYPQPEPSSQEQYLLELINAARANPAAEGQMLAGITDSEIIRYYNYYKVSTSQLVSQFQDYSAKPPLALNADLMASSRKQSEYQASAGVQTHNSADGSTFDKRITAAGYQWSGVGENIYAYAEDPFFGHVGLMVDWGVPSLDHRLNLLNASSSVPTYREIGISAVSSSVANFGPLVITEDFGTPADSSVAYLVGVIYQDANGNGAYDEGEGLGGVTVTPDGTDSYAVTGDAGGFVIPLPASGSGTLTVTASGGALGSPRIKTISYTAGTNVKLDFTTDDAAGPQVPVVTLAASPNAASVSGQKGKISISRSGGLDQPLQVALVYKGTAVNGVDYAPLPSTVTLAAGQSKLVLRVHAANVAPNSVKRLKVTLAPSASYMASKEKVKTLAKVKIVAD